MMLQQKRTVANKPDSQPETGEATVRSAHIENQSTHTLKQERPQ